MVLSLPPNPESQESGELSDQDYRDARRLLAELEHPWRGYRATPVLDQFHRSQSRLRFIIAASQVGKTMGAARELWMNAGCCHPYRKTPPPGGLWLVACASYAGTAYEGLNKALYNTRPDHLIDWKRTSWTGRYWINNMIWLKNGSQIKIVTSRGGSTGGSSVAAAGIWIDEPPRQDKMSELVARTTSTTGPIWFTFTAFDSEQDLSWLQLYLEGDPDRGIPPESPGWEKFTLALSAVNCPWMTPEQVKAVEDQTPDYIKAQRLRGAWESPPVNSYFRLDPRVHDTDKNPYPADEGAGAWLHVFSGDHGELVGHQAGVLLRIRRRRPTPDDPSIVQVEALDETVNLTRSSFTDDAADIKAAMGRVGQKLKRSELAEPGAWIFYGDVNSAGKGLAGVTANEALAAALGTRVVFRTPDKSAGSVDRGETTLRVALDRPLPSLRLSLSACPRLWRALRMHVKAKDDWQHFIDALRYGVMPYLEDNGSGFRELPLPARKAAFATPLRG